MKNASLKNTLKITGIFLLTILLATCDVGLGPSVDTTAPEITISSPSASAILKGTLNLSGTASDDGTISSVKVKLKGISSSNTKTYEYDAVVDAANKKWSLSVDSLSGEGVKDGNYEITVTATDNSEKVSYRTTTFYVDNTAPVIMVTTPDLKSSRMKHDIQIEGKIYDASEIKTIDVTICDAAGRTLISKNASLSGQGEWKVTFEGEDDLGVGTSPVLSTLEDETNPEEIYRDYYYYITAVDSVDNESSYFFHKTDVYQKFSKSKLSIDDWAKFDKGDSDTVSGQVLNRDWLSSIRIGTKNPSSSLENMPTLSYTSKQTASIIWSNIKGSSSLNENDSIIGQITPPTGVDAPFVDSTFKCYVARSVNSQSPIETDINGITNDNDSDIHEITKTEITSIGTSRSFKISTEGFGGGSYYVYIEIQNTTGQKFYDQQAFNISLSTPVLEIESVPEQQKMTKDPDFKITGVALVSTREHGCDLVYTLKKYDDVNKTYVEVETETVVSVNDNTGAWSVSLPEEEGKYEYSFTAISSGLKRYDTKTIIFDKTAPSVTPKNISADDYSLKITVDGESNDDNTISKLEWCFLPSSVTPSEADWTIDYDQSYNWKYEIITSDETEYQEVEYTFYIRVTDSAGNSNTAQKSIVIDRGPPTLEITENEGWSSKDVKTMKGIASDTHFDKLTVTVGSDNPVEVSVNPTTHEWTWAPADDVEDGVYSVVFEARDTAGKTKKKTTSFTRDKNGPVIDSVTLKNGDVRTEGYEADSVLTVEGNVSDSPAGLKKIEYRVANVIDGINNDGAWKEIEGVVRSWTANLSVRDENNPLVEGNNILYIRATDNSDNVTELAPISFITDYNEPQVWFGETSEDATDLNVSNDVQITGKLYDYANTDKIKEYKLSYTKNGTTVVVSTSANFVWNSDSDYMWSWTLPKGVNGANDGRYTFKFYYKDVANNYNTVERTVVMDTTGPVINGLLKNGQSYQSKENEIGVTFNDPLSGVDEDRLYWRIGNDTGDEVGATKFTGETVTVDFGSEGVGKKLTFIAYDESGNRSYKTYTDIIVDTKAPTIKFDEGITVPDYTNKSVTLTGTVSDTNPDSVGESGSMTVKAYVDNNEITGTGAATYTLGTTTESGTWSFTLPADSTGLKVVKIEATDAAGKTASLTKNINIDVTKPELAFTNLEDAVSDIMEATVIGGSSYTIKGTATDDSSRVKTVSYKLDDGSEISTGITLSGSNWSLPIQLGSGNVTEGGHTITISAIDNAGNTADSITTKFMVDLSKPSVTIDPISGSKYINAPLTLTGTVSDSNPLSTDAMKVVAYVDDVEVTGSGAASYDKTAGTWSFTLPVDGEDGIRKVKIEVTDAAEKTSDKTESVTVDKTSPEILSVSVQTFEDSEVPEAAKITVNVSDGTGKGVSSVECSTDNGSTWLDMTQLQTGSSSWNATLTKADLGTDEGSRTVKIRASDELNAPVSDSATFYFDKNDPVLNVSASTDASYTNSDYTLTITASDTNLKDVVITKNGVKWQTFEAQPGAAGEPAYVSKSVTIPASSGDGKYTFNITATDHVNKTAIASKTVSIDTETPVISDEDTGDGKIKIPTEEDTEATSFKFGGKASDGENGSGIEKIEISFTNKDAAQSVINDNKIDALGKEIWSYSLVFSDFAGTVQNPGVFANEGKKEVHIRATDAAGNVGDWVTKEFVYDKSEPTSTITSYNDGSNDVSIANSFDTGKTFTLKGTASDTYGVASVAVYQKIGNEETLISGSGLSGSTSWTLTELPRNPENPAETLTGANGKPVSGTYNYYAKVTDLSGKTSDSAIVTVTVDTTAPAVSITAPTAGMTGENSLSGDSYTFRGTSSDGIAPNAGVGVEKIKYAFVKADDAFDSAEPDVTIWKELSTSGNWSISRTLENGTGTPGDDELNEGHWYLFVKAVDKAGNESSVSNVHFHVDKASPALTVETAGVKDKENGTYYYKNTSGNTTFALNGTVSDTYGINKVSVKVANADPRDASLSGGNWTYTVTVPADTAVAVIITATDNSGKTVEKKYTLYNDTAAPEILITSPIVGEKLKESNKTLKGTASDTGSSVKTVSYELKKGDTVISRGSTDASDGTIEDGITVRKIELIGESWTVSNVNLGSEEGTFILSVTAEDEAGNENSQSVEQTFYVDKNYPEITETSVGEEGLTTNAAVRLSGLIYDSNELDETAPLSISASGFAASTIARNQLTLIRSDNFATYGADSEKAETGKWYHWERTLVPGTSDGQFADGRYSFTITAKDVSGETTTIYRSVVLDTSLPTVGTPTISNVTNGNYISGNAVNITGSVSDTGTGVESVNLTLTGRKNGTASEETVNATVTGNSWTYRLLLSDWNEGSLSVKAKAADKANNEKESESAAFVIDQNEPEIGSIVVDVEGTTSTSDWLTGSFTVSGSVTDTLGLSSDNFKLTINGTVISSGVTFNPESTSVNEYTWSHSVSAESSGTYVITVEASDDSGKAAEAKTRTVKIDNAIPVIEITTLDSVISGNSYMVRGTAVDNPSDKANAGIKVLQYRLDGAADRPEDGWKDISIAQDWTLPVQLGEGGLAEGNHVIEIRTEDNAGNKAVTVSRAFMVDLANPTIELNNGANLPKYTNEEITLSAVAEDSNPLSEAAMTVKAYVNDLEATEEEAASYDTATGMWKFTLPVKTDGTDDGSKTIKLVATDAAGKTAEVSKTITVDTSAPTVTVTNPGSRAEGFTLTATAYDGSGKGVAENGVLYSLDGETWTAMTKGSGSTYTANISTEALGSEGEKHVYVKATDGMNESLPESQTFFFDKDDPELTVTASTDDSYTNSDYTLTIVSATDANLRDVVITAKKDGETLSGTDGDAWKTFPATEGKVENQTATLVRTSGDGTYTFNIVATDNAEKTNVIQRTIKVDTTVPTVGTPTISVAVENGSDKYIKGNSVNVEVEASDTGVGVNSVVFNLAGKKGLTNTNETATATDEGNNKWSYRLALGDWDEGDLSISATVTDKAGNVATTQTAAMFQVDKAKPVIGAISVKVGDTAATTEWLKGNFTLSGIVSDTLAVAKDGFSLTIKKQGSSDSGKISNDDVTFAPTTINRYYNWEYTYNIGDDASGTYDITVEASDKSGQSPDPVTTTVRIDKSQPTVSISSPDDSATPLNNKTGEDSLSGDSYTFRGDSGDTGSGIAKIKYAFVKIGDDFDVTAPATPTSWEEQTAADGSWSIPRSLEQGTTGTLADDKLNEGHWYLFVKSVDKAGNESSESKIHFHVDKASPSLTVTTSDVAEKENSTLYFADDNAGYNSTSGMFTIEGTTSDTYGIKSVSITTKAGDSDAETTELATSGSWSHSFSVPADKAVDVTIKASDLSGKAVTKSYTLYRDTEAPAATISSPAQGESFITKPETVTGTVSDVGSGVESVSYNIKKGSVSVASGNATITGAGWTSDNVNVGDGEGTFTLTVTAKDTLNNEDTQEATFYVDKYNPTLTETGVGTGGKTTNSQFTLSGWVYDSNALPADGTITISSDKEDFSDIPLAISSMTEVTANNSTTPVADGADHTGWYYWTKTFYVPGAVAGQNGVPSEATILDDGTYVFTITAKDVAGKTSVIQRTVTVDTTAPVFTPKTVNGSDYINYTGTIPVTTNSVEYNWLKKSVADISLKVDDEDGGSGIKTVEYETTDGSSGVLQKASASDFWTASVPLSDGENKIRIKATDVAGNVAYYPAPEGNTANYETIRVDTTAPAVSVDSNIAAQDYITNVKAISFYLNIAETGSGIASVTATLGSGTTARAITMTNSEYGIIAVAEADKTITVGDTATPATHKITVSADALDGLSGSKMLTVKAADKVGNESISVNVANITIDMENPTIENMDFNVVSGNMSHVSVKNPVTEGNSAYFIQGGTFTITGRTRDNIGIEKTEVKVGSGTNAQTLDSNESSWSFNITPVDNGSHSTTVTVIATDQAGNTATKTIELTFDTTAPAPKHILDSNAKDLVFRVGNYDNDERPNGSTPTWDSKDEDVGGKYYKETYGNTRTITLRGYYKDEESGLSKIYYKFYDEEKINLNSTEINNLIDDVVAANQYFTPTAETTKRVFYKVADGATNPITDGNYGVYKAATASEPAEYYTEITTNFVKEALGPLNGLKDNENFLVLVAEDNVGNRAVDYAEVPNENGTGKTTYYNYVLNVDTIAPSVPTVNSITYNEVTTEYDSEHRIENLIVNKNLMADGNTIDITLSATDVGGSNVKSVELTRIGNTTLTYKDSHGGNGVYTVKIPKNDVETGAVSVRITDNAGNAADFILFSITNDSDAPTVDLSSHSSDTIVNKKITLKGTAEDANGVDSVVGVYYTRNATLGSAQLEGNATLTISTDAFTGWVKYNSTNQGGSNSWSISVDTEAQGFTDNVDHYFTVAIKDKAGNTGYSAPVKLKIEQLSDCPVIRLSNITTDGDGLLVSTQTLFGTIEDDDGTIENIYVYVSDHELTRAEWECIDWVSYSSVKSGAWSYQIKGNDGLKFLYFRVSDKYSSTPFTTPYNQKAGVDGVYMIGTDETEKVMRPLKFTIDMNPPQINPTVKVYSHTSETDHKDYNADGVDLFTNNMILGGTKKYVDIYVSSFDTNQISKMTVQISGETIDDNNANIIVAETTNKKDGVYDIFVRKNIDVSEFTSDSYQLTITAYDKSSYNSVSHNIRIDNKAPSFDVESLTSGDKVIGDTVLRGTAIDNYAGIKSISYMIPTNNTTLDSIMVNMPDGSTNEWFPMTKVDGTSSAWKVEFIDRSKETNGINNQLATFVTGDNFGKYGEQTQTNSNTWKLPILFRTEDGMGNAAVIGNNDTYFYLEVDPDGDKPTAEITYPAMADKNTPVTLGGTIRIFGGANDNIAVSSVFMQIDANGDGNFDNTDKSLLEDMKYPENGSNKRIYNPSNGTEFVTVTESTTFENGKGYVFGSGSDSWWGIKVNGKENWNLSINEHGEFNEIYGTAPSTYDANTTYYTWSGSKYTKVDKGDNFEQNYPSNYKNYHVKIPMHIRVRALDNNNKVGDWDWNGATNNNPIPVGIKIDTEGPQIDNLRLIQYADDNTTVTASQDYKADISIKGTWYLTGHINDSDGIKTLSQNSTDSSVKSMEIKPNGASVWQLFEYDSNNTIQDADFRIKFETAGSGNLNFTLTAKDDVEPENTSNYQISVKYDNSKPAIGVALTTNGGGYVIGNGDEAEGTKKTEVIQQSNGEYTIEGIVTDGNKDSGSSDFSRLAVYFMREGDSSAANENLKNNRIYNPELTKIGDYNRTYIYDENDTSVTGNVVRTIDDLPIFVAGVTKNSDSVLTLNSTSNSADHIVNIRKGGLVRIKGVYRLITDVSDDNKTVTFDPPVDENFEQAEFVYALIIDNRKMETAAYEGGVKTVYNDDGDKVIESVTSTSSLAVSLFENNGVLPPVIQDAVGAVTGYNWTLTIDSKNIPDGPIYICCVAFDNAGNVSELQKTETRVFNSRPAIANIWLGTDYDRNGDVNVTLNNDGKLISSELVKIRSIISTINTTWKNSNNAYTVPLITDTDGFTAVGNTVIKPEIVGGNGTLYYYYAVKEPDKDMTSYKLLSNVSEANAYDNNTKKLKVYNNDEYVYVMEADKLITDDNDKRSADDSLKQNSIVLMLSGDDGADTKLGGDNEQGLGNGEKEFHFKIYDSTENLVGNDRDISKNSSQWASFGVKINVQVVDTKPPRAEILPFKWNGKDDNSLYGKSTANGHIELPNDWKNSADYDSSATSGEYDADPKVSGKITIRGTADDETCLQSIWIKMEDFAGLYATKDGAKDYVQVSTFSGGSWTTAGLLEPETQNGDSDGYHFYVTNDDTDLSDGHHVEWALDLDTSRISGVVGLDKIIQVKVLDTGKNDNTMAADSNGDRYTDETTGKTAIDQEKVEKAKLQMDVVPYVTKVYTNLAKNKVSNWSVYNRTALGHYPVQSVVSNVDDSIKMKTTTSEEVILYGFNLNHSSAAFTSGGKDFATTGADTLKITVGHGDDREADLDYLKFNVAQLASGELSLTVGGLAAMNNINNNDAGSSTIQAGDAYINWYNRQGNGDTNNNQTDDIVFDVWEFNDRAAVPINGLATGINMEVNQKTGMLNYAFANGGLYYSMGGNTDATTAYNAKNSYSSIYWAGDWDTFAGPCVGFHVDELGYTYSVDSGGDTNSSGSVDKWVFYTSRWGRGKRSTAGTLSDSGSAADFNARRLEEIALKTGNGTFDYSLMKYRYLSPEFASTVSGTTTTNLYLVYYDALCNEIRFRAGQFTNNTEEDKGGFTDQYTTGAPVTYSIKNCQVIANGSTDTYNGSISGRGAGQYVDVAVVKNTANQDVVCVVWFDADANCCKFSYITNPIENWNSLKGNANAFSWSTPQTIFAEGGEYCHIVSDKNNHLHIAAYAGNGDVKYAYLDSYDSTASTCTVDASGAVGEHLTLDVAVNSKGNSIPYIGYYTSAIKMPKYAYLVDPTVDDASKTFAQVSAGTDENERFTGAWEVSVVPSPSRMTTNREDKINVGVWKNEGVLTDSKIGATNNRTIGTSSRGGELNGYNSTNWSKTFGNGTSNGVLGYQISTASGSCLETAQMR